MSFLYCIRALAAVLPCAVVVGVSANPVRLALRLPYSSSFCCGVNRQHSALIYWLGGVRWKGKGHRGGLCGVGRGGG